MDIPQRNIFIRNPDSLPPWVSPGAVADFDFKNDRYYGPQLSISRASSAYIDDSAGNWALVPANTLRRSNKGVLIEGAQTNSIRNNSIQGAVTGTPGTPPTNWTINTAGGITQSIVGKGTVNGIDYIDVNYSGTTSDASFTSTTALFLFETNTAVAAASGQLWSLSAFLQIVSGALPSGFVVALDPAERNSTGGNVRSNSSAVTVPTAGAFGQARQTVSSTLSGGANTAFVGAYIRAGFTTPAAGVAVNFTIRVGWPQLEQWSTSVTTVGGASSPVRTTGTAATRAADVVTSTLSGLSSSVTVAGVCKPLALQAPFISLAAVGSSTDFFLIQRGSDTTKAQAGGRVGGASISFAAVTQTFDDTRHAMAGSQDAGSQAVSLDGSAVGTNSVTTPSLSGNTLYLGLAGNNSRPLYGYIERLVVYPYRAANSNLQQLSTLANWGG